MASSCSKCTKIINDRSPGLQCVFCEKFFHGKCLSLNKEQLSVFNDVPGTFYKCEECRLKNVKQTGDENMQYHELLQAIKSLQSLVESMQEELKTLKEKKESENMESIINEISDRQRREKNILIYNLETTGDSNLNSQETDMKKVVDILKSIAPKVTKVINVSRLGKTHSNKPHPLKVQLATKEDVYEILKNKHKLKQMNMNIQISTDKTYLQRQYFKKILAELSNRKQNGEDNLYIKYINGRPTITTSTMSKK